MIAVILFSYRRHSLAYNLLANKIGDIYVIVKAKIPTNHIFGQIWVVCLAPSYGNGYAGSEVYGPWGVMPSMAGLFVDIRVAILRFCSHMCP